MKWTHSETKYVNNVLALKGSWIWVITDIVNNDVASDTIREGRVCSIWTSDYN
jgi:hypothetical protein